MQYDSHNFKKITSDALYSHPRASNFCCKFLSFLPLLSTLHSVGCMSALMRQRWYTLRRLLNMAKWHMYIVYNTYCPTIIMFYKQMQYTV